MNVTHTREWFKAFWGSSMLKWLGSRLVCTCFELDLPEVDLTRIPGENVLASEA